jgi:geranyl-CoA carboxylase alpha subunit
MFDTLLVANRGEIAARVIRTARRMGLRTVAVFSDADADAAHVRAADLAVSIGGSEASSSYLCIDRLLDAARRTGAGAIHPGYGFLSERAELVRRCDDAGLVFVGPPAAAMEAMGDKARAKALMRRHGVPTLPGFDGDDPTDDELIAAAAAVGFPLLVKATAGGGGRGMRVVESSEGLPDALASARAEALAGFGFGGLLLERLVRGGRHIEVQIMADAHGAVIHLGERDCSVQRRHQKVIEESPSPILDDALRAAMGAAAITAASAVGYRGAGTVEFLVDEGRQFYFLEMNTRLQVEHPVTEAVTGLDLVAWQIDIARGGHLPLRQDEVHRRGHAIEARLVAEDAAAGFLPQAGRLLLWRPSDRVRVDSGVDTTGMISTFYDPLLAKLIAVGPDRDTARRALALALDESVTLGLVTNRRFLARVLADEEFARAEHHVDWLAQRPSLGVEAPVDERTIALAAWCWAGGRKAWRSAHPMAQTLALEFNGQAREVTLRGEEIDIGGRLFRVDLPAPGRARVDGLEETYAMARDGDVLWIQRGLDEVCVRRAPSVRRSGSVDTGGELRAPMAAKVLSVHVVEGQHVADGDVLMVLEAMKIETRMRAAVTGMVAVLRATAGRAVAAGDLLARVDAVEA